MTIAVDMGRKATKTNKTSFLEEPLYTINVFGHISDVVQYLNFGRDVGTAL